jgi:hypothetical protein
MARNFRLSDLWWDDRSIGGRIALSLARRKNRRLVGRRSYVREPVTYDRLVAVYGNGLLWLLKTLAKVLIGLASALAIVGLVSLLFFIAA